MTRTQAVNGSRRSRCLMRAIGLFLAAFAIALLTACTSDSDDPAVVTLPELGSTSIPTTTTPRSGTAPAGPQEPPEVAWSLQVGGVGDDSLNAVTGDQGDVLATGSMTAESVSIIAGGNDIMTARVSPEGELQKLTQFGTGQDDVARTILTVDSPSAGSDSGAAASSTALSCGSTLGTLGVQSGGASDGWCAPAELTRSSVEGTTAVNQIGGPENESVNGAAEALTGGAGSPGFLYLAGQTDGFFPGAEDPAGMGLGAGDALALRTTSDGRTAWARQFGTSSADAALGVCSTDGNGYYVGWTDGSLSGPSNGGRDAWISLIDASGIQRWLRQFGSSGDEQFSAVDDAGSAARGDQQLIAVGSTNGDIDGAGTKANNSGGYDAIVAAFAPDGSPLWSTQFGSALDDNASGVVVDGSTIYVTGTTTSYDPASEPEAAAPGATTTTKPAVKGLGEVDIKVGPGGGRDAFLAALDATTGEPLWVARYGSAKDETATGITATENGLLVISGQTEGTIAKNVSKGKADGFLLAFPLPTAGGGAASSV